MWSPLGRKSHEGERGKARDLHFGLSRLLRGPPRTRARDAMSSSEPSSSSAAATTDESTPAAADAFSDGLMGLLSPLVQKCDEGVQQALDSQAALSQEIDRVRAPRHGAVRLLLRHALSHRRASPRAPSHRCAP